jgi:hypothetical protein
MRPYNSRGYFKTSSRRKLGAEEASENGYGLPMKTMHTDIAARANSGESEEELVGQNIDGKIRVTRSVLVE